MCAIMDLIGYYHGDPWRITPRSSAKSSRSFVRTDATEFHFAFFARTIPRSSTPAQTFLLLLLLGGADGAFRPAAYWLNPLSIIFSAYHGNTDSAVAFFLCLRLAFDDDKLLARSARK